MTTLQDILTPECTLCSVSGASKKRVLDKICTIAESKIAEHGAYELLESLTAREKLGSTGIGNGIAIPHGRLPNAKSVVAVIVTTDTPVDFNAIDNKPVDIFIALFVPEAACEDHLITLQSIAKLFSDKQMAKQVRKCQSDEELFTLIQKSTR